MNKQKKIQQQRKTECLKAKCPYIKRCFVLNGNDCIKLHGRKIPTMGLEEVRQIPEQEHGMRPYFINDGWSNDGDEWR